MHPETSHCPFLNQTDDRCAANFHVDHLHFAFTHCFDQFQSCPVYSQRLLESPSDESTLTDHDCLRPQPSAQTIVQLTLRARQPRPLAFAAGVPAASGV
jgi:hypothetical protein